MCERLKSKLLQLTSRRGIKGSMLHLVEFKSILSCEGDVTK